MDVHPIHRAGEGIDKATNTPMRALPKKTAAPQGPRYPAPEAQTGVHKRVMIRSPTMSSYIHPGHGVNNAKTSESQVDKPPQD
ncbi:hypothetical protein NPX13_g3960 [Xylaria arbuscula]|uniref:Uncharacterized protein n=1 Tax=Xylaria arbuscula TaxID=114810 RepID=A0A9W8NH99_9PEZI|nr:hypothetical protein NPX13_g3960 [Xylaria arbuscula]